MGRVKCLYCNQYFYTEKEPNRKVKGRRYAHEKCCTEDNEEYMIDCIKEYTKEKLGNSFNGQKVKKNIESLIEEGKSAKDIYRTLQYWYEIKKSDPAAANGGIAIVSYVYDEAMSYYEKKEYYQEHQYDINDFIGEDKNLKYVEKPMRAPLGRKNFNMKRRMLEQ